MMTGYKATALLLTLYLCWQQTPASSQGSGANVWAGRHAEIEEYLSTAECVSIQAFPAKHAARCTFRPGGPVSRMVWRAPSGVNRGFRESYEGEIAAYQLDRLLSLDMVPPTVARQLQGPGAGQMWVDNALPVKADDSPAASGRADWDVQLVRMSMFDNLIGNKDRSRGNMLRDAEWHLILIDQMRAFGTDSDLPNKLSRLDHALWARIESLTRHQLDSALRAWLDERQIDAILERREKMRLAVRSLPKYGARSPGGPEWFLRAR